MGDWCGSEIPSRFPSLVSLRFLFLFIYLLFFLTIVEPSLTVTSLKQQLLLLLFFIFHFFFLRDSPYIHSYFNLSTMATFFCPKGARCREVQLYWNRL